MAKEEQDTLKRIKQIGNDKRKNKKNVKTGY